MGRQSRALNNKIIGSMFALYQEEREVMDLATYEKLDPRKSVKVDDKKLVYSTPNRRTYWRVDTLFTKEPDTIAWLNEMGPEDILVDIGANVGMYSVYASVVSGAKVYAFEPEALNFAQLTKNIAMNHIQSHVTAFPLALSDKAEIGFLYLSGHEIGTSCHSFNEEINYHLEPQKFPLKQGCASAVFDDLVEQGIIEMPTYVKIDVDGLEHKIVHGMKKSLKNPKIKTVLVELNTKAKLHTDLIDFMKEFGFELSQEQVDESVRKDGSFAGIGNHIFRR